MIISRELLNILAIASKERTRFGIDGVLVYREGDTAFVVATDGRRCLELSWKDSEEIHKDKAYRGKTKGDDKTSPKFRAVIPRDLMAAVKKAVGKARNIILREEPGKPLSFTTPMVDPPMELSGNPSDATFPQYEKVFRDFENEDCVHYFVDAKALGELLLTMARCGLGFRGSNLDDTVSAVELVIPKDTSKSMEIRGRSDGLRVYGKAALMPLYPPQGKLPQGPV